MIEIPATVGNRIPVVQPIASHGTDWVTLIEMTLVSLETMFLVLLISYMGATLAPLNVVWYEPTEKYCFLWKQKIINTVNMR
jgi:hypothetical protein